MEDGWFKAEPQWRCWVLKSLFPSQIALGLAQAAIAAVMALAVVLLARRGTFHLESDAAIALLRGIVQIVAVGSDPRVAAEGSTLDQRVSAHWHGAGRRIDFGKAREEHSRRQPRFRLTPLQSEQVW